VILTLIREQLRAQRTALIWTAVVVAAAMGFSTYTLVTGATRAATNAYEEDFRPDYMPRGAMVRLTDLGAAGSIDDYGAATTTTALARDIAASNDDGSDAWAAASEWGTVATVPAAGRNQAWSGVTIMATWGATPWQTILAEGRAPLAGEIVLPAHVARDLGVGVGDAVDILHPRATPGPALATRIVSGIAYDIDGFAPWSSTPAYLDGADARMVAEISTAPGAAPRAIQAKVGWSTSDIPITTDWESGWQQFRGPALMASTALAPLLVAVTLTVGTLIMAFAVGRTQAAARVQWTATARALGARRSHLLGAGAVEGAALFATALAGGALGVGAAHVEHVMWRRSLVAPTPVDVSLPWWLLLGLIALALVLAATMGSGALTTILALSAFFTPSFTRVIRAAALGVLQEDFITSAKLYGRGKLFILARHVIPNIGGVMIVQFTLYFAAGILTEAGLSYLGVGVTRPSISWGMMLNEAQQTVGISSPLAIWPGLAIVFVVLGLNLLGDGLRDVLDPKLKRRSA